MQQIAALMTKKKAKTLQCNHLSMVGASAELQAL
jgi:hypothetical protein